MVNMRRGHHLEASVEVGEATLVYELLDAHADTAQLAAETGCLANERWRVHLDYLQALQRASREALARRTAPAPR